MTVTLDLIILPAFTHLVDCAFKIAATHGEDRAAEWLGETFTRDFELIAQVGTADPKPALTVIRGGAV
ncbi:MAG: hypothetical protein BGP16_00955 [Sphingobium sp. 66-54]|nr:MAG: hypothetical protein BGP16_00955 [Sphingobium sp. 66-54]